MIEQTLKSTGSQMVRMTSSYIVSLIEEKFKGSEFEIQHISRGSSGEFILQNSMMIISIDKTKAVKVSFHVAIRFDVAYMLVLKIKEIEQIKDLQMSAAFYYDSKELKVYYGNEAELKMFHELKVKIINDFIHEQTELMLLKNMKLPYMC